MTAAWFVDGAYLVKVWQNLHRQDKLDYLKLRTLLEETYCNAAAGEKISDAYYFTADADLSAGRTNAFYKILSYPPPNGPGLRVKTYWLQKRYLNWPDSMGGGPVVHPQSGQQYELVQQKAVDVGLAFHLMRSYGHQKWQKLFLASGDSDFHEVIQHLVENGGVNLILIGTLNSMSDELRPYARDILQLDKLADQVALVAAK